MVRARRPARTLTGVDQEERIALFLDYENLAIGARDHLGGSAFDLKPIADALAERGPCRGPSGVRRLVVLR